MDQNKTPYKPGDLFRYKGGDKKLEEYGFKIGETYRLFGSKIFPTRLVIRPDERGMGYILTRDGETIRPRALELFQHVKMAILPDIDIESNGTHDCLHHLEFCKGFHFDYHYCTVCGSKQHAA